MKFMLESSHLRRLFELQGEARELGRLTDECRRHVLGATAELLGAAGGCLVLSDEAGPGKRGQILDAVTHNFDGVTKGAFQPLLDHGSAFHPLVARMFEITEGTNDIAVESSRGILSRRDWYESPYYCDYVRQIGFDESIISIFPAELPGVKHGFGFFRERGRRPFTDEDKQLLQLIEFGLRDYVHRPPSAEGPHLSPRERQVLALLLDGLADKEIASRLEISRHNVNQRIKRLFSVFQAHSRAELMARQLRRP
jgi:DNA-binding CsgD family transcriptional regulator